jgi:hypothetical protein
MRFRAFMVYGFRGLWFHVMRLVLVLALSFMSLIPAKRTGTQMKRRLAPRNGGRPPKASLDARQSFKSK